MASTGEVNPQTGAPKVVVLSSRDNETDLFEVQSYKTELFTGKGAEEYLEDPDGLGRFRSVRNLKPVRPKGEGYTPASLLMPVTPGVGRYFLDNPKLSVAHKRVEAHLVAPLEDDGDKQKIQPLLHFFELGSHSQNTKHSVVMSDCVCVCHGSRREKLLSVKEGPERTLRP